MKITTKNHNVFRLLIPCIIALSLVTPANGQTMNPVGDNSALYYVSPGPSFADMFIGGSTGFTVGDLDEDGDPDALVGTDLGLLDFYRNSRSLKGESIFYQESNPEKIPYTIRNFNAGDHAGSTNTHPELFDFDQDGDMDLFITAFIRNSTISPPIIYQPAILYYGKQNDSFTLLYNPLTEAVTQLNDLSNSIQPNWIKLSFADINNDKRPDMIVGYGYEPSYKLKIFLNNYPYPPTVLDAAGQPALLYKRPSPEFVDIDKDGLQELFVGYSNGSVAYYENTGTRTQPKFTQVSGTGNPLDGYDFGRDAAPQFSDLDNERDFDLLVASSDGRVSHLRNDGSFFHPVFTLLNQIINPLGGLDGGSKPSLLSYLGGSAIDFANLDGGNDLEAIVNGYDGYYRYFKYDTSKTPPYKEITSTMVGIIPQSNPDLQNNKNGIPRFVDIDGNSATDFFTGTSKGVVYYYRNYGSATSPQFYLMTTPNNPLGSVDVGEYAAPTFGDLDGDLDFDVLIGNKSGELVYFENTGNVGTPTFVQNDNDNPMKGFLFQHSVPYLTDFDKDNLLDLLVGVSTGDIRYFHNIGTNLTPAYEELSGPDNPFDALTAYEFSAPLLVDLDKDGDRDLLSGSGLGTFAYFRNVMSDDEPVYRDYNYNPLARVLPVNPGIANAISINLGDVDEDGDEDAFVGTPYTLGFTAKLDYYKNIGTQNEPVYKRQPDSSNSFAGLESFSLMNVSFADIDADTHLEAFVGYSLENRTAVIDYYRYDPGTMMFFQPDPDVFPNPLTGTFAPPLSYTIGARLQFLDWHKYVPQDDLFEVFVSSGTSIYVGNNYGSGVDDPQYPYFEWSDSTYNPFFKLNTELRFDSHTTAVLLDIDGTKSYETAWVGDNSGEILTMEFSFYDPDLLATYFDEVSPDKNPFSGIVLPGPTILSPFDIDADGQLDVFVASSDGRIRLFRGADEPPESNNHVVNLPLIARGN